MGEKNIKYCGEEVESQDEIKPYIAANKVVPELTILAVFCGVLLSVVFGLANAYLGLRVGLTVSASIPAAVISMAVISFIFKKNSILESNIVQTIGSAGESLAAGAIFTLPALFIWQTEGLFSTVPSLLSITIITLCGGLLGVLFMVPLRNALIVKEHYSLPYPEGIACAEVLLAGEKGGSSAKSVFAGIGISAVFKFLIDGIKIIPSSLSYNLTFLKTQISTEIYPALVSVGYICGFRVSSLMLTGGIIGWLVLIPMIVLLGGETIVSPEKNYSVVEIYNTGGAIAIWSKYIRYIGAGAVAVGGIISLLKSTPLIIKTFISAIASASGSSVKKTKRTEQDLNFIFVSVSVFVITIAIYLLPQIPVSFIGTLLIVLFGFFFATVSSRIVGLLGSTNNPVSGMTIATLIVSTGILRYFGILGSEGMQTALIIGAIVCIISCIAGDSSQDLKTGFLLGATPKKQQIGEIIGVLLSSLAIGVVLLLLNKAWGFGNKDIPAPQATLMKMIIQGGMNGELPWNLILIGGFIAIAFEIVGIASVPIASGVYLPLSLSVPIILGGIIRYIVDKRYSKVNNGILFCSGLIAGEGLIGILLAVFAIANVDTDLSKYFNARSIGGFILLLIILVLIYLFSKPTNKKTK